MIDPIPLVVCMERRCRNDDGRMDHRLCVTVVGMVAAPLTAIIESRFHQSPRVKLVTSDGGFGLPHWVRDDLLIALFAVLRSDLRGGDAAALWPMYDATPWIQTQFATAVADVLLTALHRHVTPELRIDWANCAAFLTAPDADTKGSNDA